MKTMNGFTNELLVKKAKRNWRTRCGAFLLAVLASWYGGNAVFGDAIISLNGRGLGDNIAFDTTPRADEGQAGENAGHPGTPAASSYIWTGQVNPTIPGLNLNRLSDGFTVNTVNTETNTPGAGATLSTNDHLRVSGGATFKFTTDINWGSGNFTIDGDGSATIEARGGNLNLGNKLTNNGTLNLRHSGTNYSTGAVVTVGNSVNNGTISIDNVNFNIAGNNFSGSGTVLIGPWGELQIDATQVSQNIQGQYNHSTGITHHRGMIRSVNSVEIDGTVSGSVGFTGGGTFNLTQNNSGISNLFVWNNSNIRLSDQSNIGTGTVTLRAGGGLTKNNTLNDLHLTNDIAIESGSGSLNSRSSSVTLWQIDADTKNDGGSRLVIDGSLTGVGVLNINNLVNDTNTAYAGGTVVLTQSNPQFHGDIYIERGVLEISGQRNIGSSNNTQNRTITIGNGSIAPTARSVFRVVGSEAATETITHWVNLGTQNSFYEVFTNTHSTIPVRELDGDGNQVYRTQDGTGARVWRFFDADGLPYYRYQNDDNAPIVPDTDNVAASYREMIQTIDGHDLRNMPDADRLTVVQAGQVTGDGTLNKTGDGILHLNVHNSYTGDTVIWHGVLRVHDQNAINNNNSANLKIGGQPLMEDDYFRPVFETILTEGKATGTITINAAVALNQTNSIVRTTGVGNRTVFTNTVSTDLSGQGTTYAGVLNKDGAGTLVLQGLGSWGIDRSGETKINQGTLEFSKQSNLAGGKITIGTDWHTYKDIETLDADGNPITYKATLKLADNSTESIGNHIVLGAPAPGGGDDADAGSYIEVGNGSVLTVRGAVSSNFADSNLNKIGKGDLVLQGEKNSYTGWTNVYEGKLTTDTANNMTSTAGVNLIGNGTTFDMSATSADQTINGLKGLDNANATNPDAWTRRVLIGDNTLTLNQTEESATLHGAILGTGTFVKAGAQNSEFITGFQIGEEKFKGKLDIQVGGLVTLTDAYVTGLTGKSGTYFDVRDNELTIDIGTSQAYDGTIISSYPPLPYDQNTVRPHIIKDGAGTLTAGFFDRDVNTGIVRAFEGNLTINQGNIVSTSDFYMEGGGKLTFGVNTDLNGNVTANVLDVSKNSAMFRVGGVSGKDHTYVHAKLGDSTTGWTTPSGIITIGKILGNDKSDYSGLVASSTDSLFHELELYDVRGVGRYDKYVNLNVTGFGGLGNTYNTRAVGNNLDAIRVTDLSGNHISSLIQDLWAAGTNIEDEATRQQRTDLMLGIYRQLSADTIANAMFMGLDKPWQAAFARLNLDSQMVYVAQPQAGGQRAIANMRNLWFTPTVQSLSARADGNARKFGIDRPGYKIGFDKRVAQNTSLGFQLGYSSPKLHQGDDRIEASDFQFGVYGGAMVGYYVEMKGFIGFGHQNYKSNRNIYLPNDAVVPDGNGGFRPIGGANRTMVSHGRYDGDTFNFSFEVSRPLFLGFTILRPTIGLDSEHAFRYAFTETGDVTSMKFNRSSLSRTRARFGLSLETTTLDRAIFTGRLGYSCLLGGNDYAEAKGQFVGVYAPTQVTRSVAVGTSYFEAGVGTRVFLNPVKTLALVGSYDATVGNRWAEHQGLVGFTYIY